MSCCNCGQPKKLCRCPQKGEAPQRAYIAECTDCDPCRPCESMVKICSFVAPTLTEGQRFRNSFIYNQEDDTVYYIDNSGTPTRFGSSPMFIDNFNPDDRKIPRQTVFDFANNKAYIYNPEGDCTTVDLAGGTGDTKKQLSVVVADDAQWDPVTLPSADGLVTFSTADVTFTDAANVSYTLEQVFNMLEDGGSVVLNDVPFAISDIVPIYPEHVDGVEITARGETTESGAFSIVITEHTGVAGIGFYESSAVEERTFLPHICGITRHVAAGVTSYFFTVQRYGVE